MQNEIITILVAASPISELRGAIPLAVKVFNFSFYKTIPLVLLGNFLPVPVILYFLSPAEKFFRRFKFLSRFFDWLYKRTRHKFEGKYLKWGEIALLFFVAIPLPITGAWTASLASYLFGIPKKQSMIFIFLGIIVASIIVSALTGIL